MAISSITKPIGSTLSKLRLRSKPKNTASPPPETASPGSIGGGEIASAPRSGSKEDQFRKVFDFLDANTDGKISADELRAYFASVGDTASYEEAGKIIGELSGGGADADDLLLGFEEFSRVMESRDGGEDEAVLRRAFEVYEVEKGSGCITAEGLREVLRRIGVDVKSVQECEAMIGVYDLDGNGVLDFGEFYKMMTYDDGSERITQF